MANPKLEVNNSLSASELASCQISPENSDEIKAMEVLRPVHLASNKENLPISPKSSDNSLESSSQQVLTSLKSVSCQASDLISPEPSFAIKLQTFNSQINQDQLVALSSLSSSTWSNGVTIDQSLINSASIGFIDAQESQKLSKIFDSQLALVPESNYSQLTKFSTTSNYNFTQFNKFDQTLALLSEQQFENLTSNSLDSFSLGILNSEDSKQVKELLDVQLAQTENSGSSQSTGGDDTFSNASAAAVKS